MEAFMASAFPWLSMGLFVAVAASLCTEKVRNSGNVKKAKDEFMICYFRPDIMKFLNTGWGVVNAMSDMISHSAPRRQTGSYRENNWNRIMDGHKMLDRMTELVCAR